LNASYRRVVATLGLGSAELGYDSVLTVGDSELATCRSGLLLPPWGEQAGMRGARRESKLSEKASRLREVWPVEVPAISVNLPMRHAPLTPSLSPHWGKRKSPVAAWNLDLAPVELDPAMSRPVMPAGDRRVSR
jgi:hypothetical protein